jgi:hypothetical protein
MKLKLNGLEFLVFNILMAIAAFVIVAVIVLW